MLGNFSFILKEYFLSKKILEDRLIRDVMFNFPVFKIRDRIWRLGRQISIEKYQRSKSCKSENNWESFLVHENKIMIINKLR